MRKAAISSHFASRRYTGPRGIALAAWLRTLLLLLLAVLPLALLACAGESSVLGQYRQGRTLHFSVVSLERTQELRYATIDPQGVIRRWSISPSAEGMELVLVRARVENHTAVSAVINVDRTSAELRDFANAKYLPLSITEAVWQDFRGEPEALIRMDLGQCFDGTRALIDAGATARWQSESEDDQYIAFENAAVSVGPEGRAEIAPGASLTHTFGQPGTYPYVCGGPEEREWPAEILRDGSHGRDRLHRAHDAVHTGVFRVASRPRAGRLPGVRGPGRGGVPRHTLEGRRLHIVRVLGYSQCVLVSPCRGAQPCALASGSSPILSCADTGARLCAPTQQGQGRQIASNIQLTLRIPGSRACFTSNRVACILALPKSNYPYG